MQTIELLDKESAVAEYKPFYAQLADLEKNNTAVVFDYASKKGNKEARSHVFALRKSSAELERTRVAAKSESLKIGRAIDSEAKEISARISAMIDVHQVELDKIEKIETDRIEKIQTKLSALSEVHHGKSVADYKFHIQTLEAVVIDESWQEFITNAAQAKDASIAKHRELLAEKEQQDLAAAELDRLRKEAADRAQKDRDDEIAAKAAAKAKEEAEAIATRQAELARKAIEDAEAKAKQEREDADHRELKLKLDAEVAERRRIESEQKAEQDKIAALAKAESDKHLAIQQEQDRVALVKKMEEEDRAKREANIAHKKKINNEALKQLVAGGISEECAKNCIKLIAGGYVSSISISY